MKKTISFIKKEFYHILRDPLTLLIMFIFPAMLMLLLSYAVSTDIKNIPFTVLNPSKSTASQRLVEQIDANAYFNLKGNVNTLAEMEQAFQKGICSIGIIFPADFGKEPFHSGSAYIQLLVDASDPNQASTMVNYLQTEIMGYQPATATTGINVKMLYNPQMLSSFNIVPGLQGMILMLICALMTSVAIVREKETGTMEILLVSPLKPQTIIFGKAIPYLLVSFIDVILILALSAWVFKVPINGSIPLILLLSFIYIFTSLALGIFISSVTQTQQAAMIAAGIGLLMPCMLLSGLIFPVESMPALLRGISCVVPARWFIEALRDVMIKGLGIAAIWKDIVILSIMCTSLMVISIKKFKNRL